MNSYVVVGLVLVAIWIASIYVINEMKRVVQINARITQEGAEEIAKQLRETNQLLKEIRDIEFVIDEEKIKNARYIPVRGWDKSFNENPFEDLRKAEEKINRSKNES